MDQVYGASSYEKFSYYLPTYIILGEEDLKIQFSGKYRLTKSLNLYFAYTQLMFWNVYDESKPFRDINFNPEVFYRLLEGKYSYIKSLDFGYSHVSNGKDQLDSRSMDKIYFKINAVYPIEKKILFGEFQFHQIRKEDNNNRDIQNYVGYWDVLLIFKNVLSNEMQNLDFEFKTFSGKEIFDFNRGARVLGLIYQTGSENFSPSIYLQYYSGYAQSLLEYKSRVDELRLGLMLYL